MVGDEEFRILHCAGCGTRVTDPMPPADAIARYYDEERYYVSLAARHGGLMNRIARLVRFATVRWRARLVAASSRVRPGRILDVGCGTGELLAHLRGRGWNTWGVEPMAGARAHARRTPGVRVLDEHEFQQLRGVHFDVATLWHVIEHVHDPNGALTRVGELLTDDGALIVACPNYASDDGEYYGSAWAAYDPPRHLWHFTPASMERLLAKHGFAIDTVRPLTIDPLYIAAMSERIAPHGLPLLHPLLIGARALLAGFADTRRASAIAYVARKQPLTIDAVTAPTESPPRAAR